MNTAIKLGIAIGLFFIAERVAEQVIIAFPGDKTGFWDLRNASPFWTNAGAAAVGGTTMFIGGKILSKVI